MSKLAKKKEEKVKLGKINLDKLKSRLPKIEVLSKEAKEVESYDQRLVKVKKEKKEKEEKENKMVSLTDLPFTKIQSIGQIIVYVNQLTSKQIHLETELSKNLELIGDLLPDSVKDEYLDQLSENEIFNIGKRVYPIKYKIINEDASNVQLNLIQCIAVVQDIFDKAKVKGIVDGYAMYQFYTLMGALDELCYRIDPENNELLSLSQDQTHLRKNVMAVYSNASKLISIETKIVGEDKQTSFEKYMARLSQPEQLKQIEDFVIPNFNPMWIEKLDYDIIQRILNLIIQNPELDVTISPTTLLELFKKFRMSDRREFLKHLSISLVGEEYGMFTKKE